MELAFYLQGNEGPLAASLGTGIDFCAAKEHYACMLRGPSMNRKEPLHNLARMHEYGMGGPRDWDEAERLFLEAFELGNQDSGHNLAVMVIKRTRFQLQLQPEPEPEPKTRPRPRPRTRTRTRTQPRS